MHASSFRAGTITETVGPLRPVFAALMAELGIIFCVWRISILLGVSLLLSGCYGNSKPAHVGTVAPDFTVQDADRKVSLSQLRGQVVVLNFWATWCQPCIEEMPSLVQMQERMKSRGVTVLAVSMDEDVDAYQRFLKTYKVNLLTVRDEQHHSNALYGTKKFPETYVIDRSGIMRRKFIGAVDWTQPEIVDYLNRL